MSHDKLRGSSQKILEMGIPESDFVEYKATAEQKDKILKTLVAFANNLMNRPERYLFLGVEEEKRADAKAVPTRPIKGFLKEQIENVENAIKAFLPFITPNPQFDVTHGELDGAFYVVVGFAKEKGGPFSVNEKGQKATGLKMGRYVRVERDSRLANFQEEFFLLKKFADYHFSEEPSEKGTIDDLDLSLIREYLRLTSDRENTAALDKTSIAEKLSLLDPADPTKRKVRNFALLMFSAHPEDIIPGAYLELIRKSSEEGSLMQGIDFRGPVWKQVKAAMDYLSRDVIRSFTMRPESQMESRKVFNYPYGAIEELLTNAIVHKNYETPRTVQFYFYPESVVIVNYNRPLPPLNAVSLNKETRFPDRQYENPSLAAMFKSLDLIESYGSGVGEAKRQLAANGSPELSYKEFGDGVDITSVTVEASREFLELSESAGNAKQNADLDPNVQENQDIGGDKLDIGGKKLDIEAIVRHSGYSKKTVASILLLRRELGHSHFGRSEVVRILGCSPATGSNYIEKMLDLCLLDSVLGEGKGKYRFKGA